MSFPIIPELTQMQVRAIFEAACICSKDGVNVQPEVMIPLTSHVNELKIQQSQLEEVADSLKLTVDYGWLTIISQPLFWLLSLVYSFAANWGVAIIVVTILIKLVFYKLTEKSGRSMAKMREIQPRVQSLQERYKDDRQA